MKLKPLPDQPGFFLTKQGGKFGFVQLQSPEGEPMSTLDLARKPPAAPAAPAVPAPPPPPPAAAQPQVIELDPFSMAHWRQHHGYGPDAPKPTAPDPKTLPTTEQIAKLDPFGQARTRMANPTIYKR